MKNSLERLYTRFELAEKRTTEHEDKSIENIQYEQKKGKS